MFGRYSVRVGELAGRLRKSREDAFLSQEELAKRAGVQAATVSRIERGVIDEPYLSTLRKLAKALDVDPKWLRSGD